MQFRTYLLNKFGYLHVLNRVAVSTKSSSIEAIRMRLSQYTDEQSAFSELEAEWRNFNAEQERINSVRKSVTPQLRMQIFKRDRFRCRICGRGVDQGVSLRIDHIQPVTKKGDSNPSNLQTLCDDCNIGKGNE